MTTIRGSKTDLALACASSMAPTDAPYSPQSDDSLMGQAKHDALARMVRGEEVNAAEIADRYRVDADEIEIAVAVGRKAWRELGQWFPNARTEVALDGLVSKGTADVLSVDDDAPPKTISILDFKTGWSRDEHSGQLFSYADAARHQFGLPQSGYITAIEVWLAHGERNIVNLTAAALDGFRERMRKQFDLVGKQYGPGDHCKFCPHQNHCASRDEYLRSASTALAPLGQEPRALSRDVLGQLYGRSQMLARALRQYDDQLKAALADGPILLGDGKALALVPKEKDRLDPVLTERILRGEGWTDSEVGEVMSAAKGAVEKIAKGRVSHGGGAGEMRRLLKLFDEAGARSKVVEQHKQVVDLHEKGE